MNTLSSNTQYPALDLKAINEGYDNLSKSLSVAEALYDRYQYLPVENKRCAALRRDADAATYGLQEACLNSKIDLLALISKLRAFENYPPVEESASKWSATAEKDLARVLADMFDTTREGANTIRRRLADIRNGINAGQLSEYREQKEREQELAREQQKALENDLLDPIAKRKVLTDAIAANRNNGIDKIGKEVMLSIDNLQGLGLAPPQAQLVALAITQLKKSLEHLGQAVTFVRIIDESNRLLEVINKIEDKISEKKKEIEQFAGKGKFIDAIQAADVLRQAFVKLYAPASDAFETFLAFEATNSKGDLRSRTAAAIKEAQDFVTFVEPLARP